MSYLPLIDLKNGFWPVVHLLYRISEWNFTDMLNIKGYIYLVRTVTLTFPVHELSALDWSEKWFLNCSSFTIWSIWMKLHRYVDHQRLHIVTKDVISLSISVLLLFRHYISHKITFGAPSSGGVLRSACGAFILIMCYGCSKNRLIVGVLNETVQKVSCLFCIRPFSPQNSYPKFYKVIAELA